MYTVKLKGNKEFICSSEDSILEAALKSNIILEHSCKTGRCSACKVMVIEGKTCATEKEHLLSRDEELKGYILTCVRKPQSDLSLDIEDLSHYKIPSEKTLPSKIYFIKKLNNNVIHVGLRFPPNNTLDFLPGQYVDIIKGSIKRSYSIANAPREDNKLEFFIKNYEGGQMSQYWFQEAQENDLLRVQGPKGTFFLRDIKGVDNIIFLATGTGIAPVKAILESLHGQKEKIDDKKIFVIWGGRYRQDHFWSLNDLGLKINYIPVLSREDLPSIERGYIQQVLQKKEIELNNSVFYACGSDDMIHDAKALLVSQGVNENDFYSDAFVISN